jgi:hypothetical protein
VRAYLVVCIAQSTHAAWLTVHVLHAAGKKSWTERSAPILLHRGWTPRTGMTVEAAVMRSHAGSPQRFGVPRQPRQAL